MPETVQFTKESGVGLITLHRPEVYNAFNQQMGNELVQVLKEAAKDADVRAVLLTGAGKAFCSGQDLRDRSDANLETLSLGNSVRTRYNPIVRAIVQMGKPVIASVNGVAAGAGCSLALACDLRIISDRAKFVVAFARIGLAPDSGASYFLPRLVGFGRAMEIALTGRDVEAQEAMQIGMADRMVPHEQLGEEAFKWAMQLAHGPTKAYSLTKRALFYGMEHALEEALEYEAQMQEIAGKTEDFREGVTAFAEKRKPKFHGR